MGIYRGFRVLYFRVLRLDVLGLRVSSCDFRVARMLNQLGLYNNSTGLGFAVGDTRARTFFFFFFFKYLLFIYLFNSFYFFLLQWCTDLEGLGLRDPI